MSEIDCFVSDFSIRITVVRGDKWKNYKYNRWSRAQKLSVNIHLILLLQSCLIWYCHCSKSFLNLSLFYYKRYSRANFISSQSDVHHFVNVHLWRTARNGGLTDILYLSYLYKYIVYGQSEIFSQFFEGNVFYLLYFVFTCSIKNLF